MNPEEIKSAVIQLLEANAALDNARQYVADVEAHLTNLYNAEDSILDEWNTIKIDDSFWDLKFDIESGEFESLKPNRFKHF